MMYKILDGIIIESVDVYDQKMHSDFYFIDKSIPIQKLIGYVEGTTVPVYEPNTYTLTYQDKLDSLRFKRGYLLQQTDCGMVTDCPLSEEQKVELATYRQSLRDFSKDVTEENVDTYKLHDAPEWAITWFKL